MTTALTRAIQRRHGYKPLPYTCPECGHTRPPLGSFPTSNLMGVAALLWATTGRKAAFGATIFCPKCGEPLTFDEELARRRRHSGS